MLRIILGLLLSFVVSQGFAQTAQPLPLDKAFVFTSYVDENENVTFQWEIAPGYFLYQNKLKFTVSPPSEMTLGKIIWPKSHVKPSPDGSVSIYSGLLKITVPFAGKLKDPLVIAINYQGCSLGGFCYPPVKRYLHLNAGEVKPKQDLTGYVTATSEPVTFLSDQDMAQKIFAGHSVVFIIMSFLGLGLLLAFTPCVLPMIPVLSSIIVGHNKKVSTWRGFSLSLAYVLGMAITYAVAGVVVAMLGSSVQVILQKTWVIGLFSGLFVLLSLSLFGLYELQMPNFLHRHTTNLSNRLAGGTYVSVFLMGCLSTLIVSPCVSAPLVGVLAYIAQTGDVFLGGAALLMLGIGMGVPLLLIGTSAGKWLPKAGQWMGLVKKLFGILMLAVAIWMLSRILPGAITLLLWALWCIGVGVFFGIFCKPVTWVRWIFQICAPILFVYGIILVAGAALGSSDPLHPWEGWNTSVNSQKPLFTVFKNETELAQQLAFAKQSHKKVMLDFYATWCVSCVYMDKHVFNQEEVRHALADFVLLRADVTENNAFDQEIMRRYHVIAPPAILFLDDSSKEIISHRIVGEVSAQKFLNNLRYMKEGQRAK